MISGGKRWRRYSDSIGQLSPTDVNLTMPSGPIMNWDMPWTEMIIGLPEVFILGGLTGAAIAALYNVGIRTQD